MHAIRIMFGLGASVLRAILLVVNVQVRMRSSVLAAIPGLLCTGSILAIAMHIIFGIVVVWHACHVMLLVICALERGVETVLLAGIMQV